MKYVSAYAVALIVFLVVDAVWIGIVARGFYISRIGAIMLDQPRWGAAAIFYALYVAGLIYFAVSVGLRDGNWQAAALNGAVLGFVAYLTYNATNLTMIRGYDALVAIVDTAWGSLATALTAGTTVAILGFLGRSATG